MPEPLSLPPSPGVVGVSPPSPGVVGVSPVLSGVKVSVITSPRLTGSPPSLSPSRYTSTT